MIDSIFDNMDDSINEQNFESSNQTDNLSLTDQIHEEDLMNEDSLLTSNNLIEDYFDTDNLVNPNDSSYNCDHELLLDDNLGLDLDNHNILLDESNSIVFKGKEDMLPYEEKTNFDVNHRSDPFGLYALRFHEGLSNEDFVNKPNLPMDFSEHDLQGVCNTICDVLHIRHLPVFLTYSVPNAEHCTLGGPFMLTLFDDKLSLNPDFAKECIDKLGTTDIIQSEMAHEIGHALVSKYCGNLSTYMQEKIADFVSGFINCKMGIDLDVTRQWFQWQYDPNGEGGYPISEERWDIESAGYYFGKMASSDELKHALSDIEFLKIIKEYKNENVSSLAFNEWLRQHTETNNFTETIKTLFDKIENYLGIQRL